MRPYMLWLTRYYAGLERAWMDPSGFYSKVVTDWARRLREHEFARDSYPHEQPLTTIVGRNRAYHMGTSSESPRRVADRRAAQSSARGALQGGR